MNVLKWTSRVGLALAGMVFPTAFTIAQVSIDLSSQQADLTLYGAGENSHFGQAVATGDLNGDGQKDLIIGAPGWAAPDQAPGGAVFIFWGRTNLQGSIDLSTETADVLISGSAGGGNLGASLFAADLDGDQIDDLVLGNPDFTPDTLTRRVQFTCFGDAANGRRKSTWIACELTRSSWGAKCKSILAMPFRPAI